MSINPNSFMLDKVTEAVILQRCDMDEKYGNELSRILIREREYVVAHDPKHDNFWNQKAFVMRGVNFYRTKMYIGQTKGQSNKFYAGEFSMVWLGKHIGHVELSNQKLELTNDTHPAIRLAERIVDEPHDVLKLNALALHYFNYGINNNILWREGKRKRPNKTATK